jgi:hypothetical protein
VRVAAQALYYQQKLKIPPLPYALNQCAQHLYGREYDIQSVKMAEN